MTSLPDNLPSPTENSRPSKSDSDLIDDLLQLLLDSDSEQLPDNSPLAEETSVKNFISPPEVPDLADIAVTLDDHETERKIQFNSDSTNFQYPDIDVEIESKVQQEITLQEAVEYKAFLRQKIGSKEQSTSPPTDHKSEVGSVAQQYDRPDNESEIQLASQEDLIDAVNLLIPLIVELLKDKIDESQETIIQTVAPVLDRLIEQRSREDSQKMATAIAKILPPAITTEIEISPEAIAKAIAPEIALAIQEQIRLDENAISHALGSEMGKAIKTQIELERDAMVDALYPVIGSTISKYMVEVVQDINRKVETALSPEGIKRKIKAKIQGVSEAELILQEAVGYHVQAVFLIDKDSGVVIQEVQTPGEQHLDADMIAGMLTAIRSFANDCIASGSELDAIDYGDWQIPIEVAGYCYLAVVLKGEPSKHFRSKIRRILSKIVLNYGDAIEKYQGDMATVPQEIKPLLEELIQQENEQPGQSSSPPMLVWLLALMLGIIFIPWGIVNYRARVARNVEQITANQLDAAPELSVYRLESKVHRGKLTLTGRVPSEYLRERANAITKEIARQKNLQLDNQILTVNVPVNPSLITGEIKRLTTLFNQQPTTAIKTFYQPQTLTIEGFILNESDLLSINQAFQKIPGIEQIIINVVNKLPIVKQRIYFEFGSSQLNFADNSSKIEAVIQFLHQYPQLNLQLISHSDGLGPIKINQKLGRERCHNVQKALIARGVEQSRLVINCDRQLVPENKDNQPSWSHRYVSFEPLIPSN